LPPAVAAPQKQREKGGVNYYIEGSANGTAIWWFGPYENRAEAAQALGVVAEVAKEGNAIAVACHPLPQARFVIGWVSLVLEDATRMEFITRALNPAAEAARESRNNAVAAQWLEGGDHA
jgi:hypothetical protein